MDAAPLPKSRESMRVVFPTTVGTQWVYESSSGEDIVEAITDVKEKDGKVLITISNILEKGEKQISRIIELNEKGIFKKFIKPYEFDPPTPELFFSDKESKWKFESTGRSEGAEVRIKGEKSISGPEKIKVPAGTFEAFKIEASYSYDDTAGKASSWYSTGVGLIKCVADGNPTITLKKFTEGKK
jgi:hypothetical protein